LIDTILITGSSGYMGKTIIPFLVEKYKPKSVRLFSRNDWRMAEQIRSYNDLYKFRLFRPLIGDIYDRERIMSAVDGCDLVIHCAAMKRLEIANYSPQEAIKVNIIGSMNVMDSCLQKKVRKAIFVSSDKAVHPTNLYGATKKVMEEMVIQRSKEVGIDNPTMCCTRWGNVIGSTGAVIPYFIKLAKENKNLPITNESMTRFIITKQMIKDTIEDAIENGKQGEVILPKNMQAVKIIDAAQWVINYLDSKSKLEVIGTFSQEKLHEEITPGITSESATMTRETFLDILKEENLI
jgi:UDP-N-acetylglucosamine 4,6-dehydratase/5-epimerase